MTATQTMEVVYGLFNNMKVVMDGTDILLDISAQHPDFYFFRWKGVNRSYPRGSWYDRLEFVNEYS